MVKTSSNIGKFCLMRSLAFPLLIFGLQKADAQKVERVLVHNIDSLVEKIDKLVPATDNQIKNTVLYGIEERTRLPDTQHVHTQYFISYGSVIKVIKNTKYKYWTHREIIYVQNERPIKYNRQSYYLNSLKDDFDIYFNDDKAVYQIEHVGLGRPHPPTFLAFCYQILNAR